MKYFGAATVLLTAFALSAIAAVMSITGMMALFAAHQTVVAIMMATLEVAKVVASGWLKVYWTDDLVPRLHKGYLVTATVILMLITSLGIYGYLSAGHLEQLAPLANNELQQGGLEQRIEQKKAEVTRMEARVALLDKNVESFLNSDKATGGLRASQSVQKERDKLQGQITTSYAEINDLSNQLMPLKQASNEVQAKLGPIKYVADLFGWSDPEAAVRFIIVMIMLVFDPLAIVLMISGLITLSRIKPNEPEVVSAPVEPEPELIPEPESEPEVEEELVEEEEHDDPADHVEETFDIVQSIDTKVSELDDADLEESEIAAEVEEDIETTEEIDQYDENEDHRERLIRLLQAEPSFLREVEAVIDQIAKERIAEENAKIVGGYTPTEENKSYGADH